MRFLAIVGLSVLAAVAYGIVHDQVTARVCVEYFTIGHPPIFRTESPTLLGIGWGIIATWWAGAILGFPLAIAATAGPRPPRSVRSLVRPIRGLLGGMAACALLSGLTAYALARNGAITLVPELAEAIPRAKHAAFLADGGAHLASYGVGFLGGAVLIAQVWRSRQPARTMDGPPESARPRNR